MRADQRLLLVATTCLFSFGTWASPHLPAINVAAQVNEVENRPAGLLSSTTHQKMQRAHALIKNNQYDKAMVMLKKLKKSAASRPGELAQIHQTMGFVAIESDRLKQAMAEFETALNLKAMPKGPTMTTLYTLSQLQLSESQHQNSIKTLKTWFALSDSPGGEAYALLANAYAQTEQKKASFANIKQALKLTKSAPKGWLQLGTALAFELGSYKEAANYLKRLTAMYPAEKSHWTQLAGTYMHLNQPKQALATMEMAKMAGHLKKESEILNLVSLYLNREIPYWAAVTLEMGLKDKVVKPSEKSLLLLAQCYLQAEESTKALEPLKKAAAYNKDGKVELLMGQIHLEKENWKQAMESFKGALSKGALKNNNLGMAHLGLGMAQLELKHPELAKKSFEKALGIKTTKNTAKQFLAQLDQI